MDCQRLAGAGVKRSFETQGNDLMRQSKGVNSVNRAFLGVSERES